MSDTPRTDNEAWSEGSSVPELVTADFARQLERELTAAREELAATKELLSATQTECLARANDLNHGADREIALEDTIAILRTETQEQARLLGMSGEREADLRGEIERLRRRVEAGDGLAVFAAKVTNWLTGASKRSFAQEMVNRGRFDSLADANNHDGRNFGRMASDGEKYLAAYRATEGKK